MSDTSAGDRLLAHGRAGRADRARRRSRPWSTRTATSTRPTARWRRPAGSGGCGRHGHGHADHAQGPRAPGRRRRRPPPEELEGPADADAAVADWPESRGPRHGRRARRRRAAPGAGPHPPGPPQARRTGTTGPSSSCRSTTSRCSSASASSSGSRSSRWSCARATRRRSSRWRTCWARSRSWCRPTRRSWSGRSRPSAARPESLEDAGRPTAEVAVDEARDDGRRGRRSGRTARATADAAEAERPRRGGGRPTPSRRSPRRPRSRRASSSRSRPASSPTTTSPRPAARSSGSTSPGWSPARPGPATGKDVEELHGDARRDPAAAGRVAGVRRRLRRGADRALHEAAQGWSPRDLGAVRDLDVLIEAGEAYQKRQPARRGATRSNRCSTAGAASATRPATCSSTSSTAARYRSWLDGYVEFMQADGMAARPVGARGPAPRPRHDAVADLGGLRGRPRVRAGHALGRRHHAPRPADRREVAALHAGVRPRGARARRRARDREGRRAPGPPRLAPRRGRRGRPRARSSSSSTRAT